MKAIKDKKFIVIGQFDDGKRMESFTVYAQDHDVAAHLMELENSWGAFIACDNRQARKLVKNIQSFLKK